MPLLGVSRAYLASAPCSDAHQQASNNSIRALQLQPSGVIRSVYPSKGNENVVGLNLFACKSSQQRPVRLTPAWCGSRTSQVEPTAIQMLVRYSMCALPDLRLRSGSQPGGRAEGGAGPGNDPVRPHEPTPGLLRDHRPAAHLPAGRGSQRNPWTAGPAAQSGLRRAMQLQLEHGTLLGLCKCAGTKPGFYQPPKTRRTSGHSIGTMALHNWAAAATPGCGKRLLSKEFGMLRAVQILSTAWGKDAGCKHAGRYLPSGLPPGRHAPPACYLPPTGLRCYGLGRSHRGPRLKAARPAATGLPVHGGGDRHAGRITRCRRKVGPRVAHGGVGNSYGAGGGPGRDGVLYSSPSVQEIQNLKAALGRLLRPRSGFR